MPDLADGESTEMQGSGSTPYTLKNTGGVYSCSCPAWRNQSVAIEKRTCKHLRKLRGDEAEVARVGAALPGKPAKKKAAATGGAGAEAADDDEGPPLLLAETWDNVLDLAGWWMSEKLDGVRAYWDGKQFLSRQGNLYHAPDWFTKELPNVPLDGELWIGRKKFQRTVSIVRRQDRSDHWKEVRYLVFDAPAHDHPFEGRLAFVKKALGYGLKYAEAHEHVLCKDVDSLRAELARVEKLGGEGLMLRKPGSKYVAGRSSTLLKVKSFRDAEAIVTGHQAGEGRHKGRMGALLVRLPDGTDFAIGTGFSDSERSHPPPTGATVTFRYQELSEAGVPRFPSWVGIRHDITLPPVERKSTATPAKPAPAAAPAAPLVVTAGKARRFEFSEGTSNKFWEVSQSGNTMTTRWGRIGSTGQSKTKTFADEKAARHAVELLVEEKTDEGYVERA